MKRIRSVKIKVHALTRLSQRDEYKDQIKTWATFINGRNQLLLLRNIRYRLFDWNPRNFIRVNKIFCRFRVLLNEYGFFRLI